MRWVLNHWFLVEAVVAVLWSGFTYHVGFRHGDRAAKGVCFEVLDAFSAKIAERYGQQAVKEAAQAARATMQKKDFPEL